MAGVPVPVIRRSSVLRSSEVENRDLYPATSRYRSVKYFQRDTPSVGSYVEAESWYPTEIPKSQTDLFTKVKSGEEGRLDLVALRVYGLPQLWWVIAFANDVIDPFEEITVNRVLRYPPIDYVSTNILT